MTEYEPFFVKYSTTFSKYSYTHLTKTEKYSNIYVKEGITVSEKEERFIRIAEKRTNKILEQIRLLGNCSNKNNYTYDDQQVDKIFKAIEKELDLAKKKYLINKNKSRFSLR